MRGCSLGDVLKYDTTENTLLFGIAKANDVIPHLKIIQALLFHVIALNAGKEGQKRIQRMAKENRHLKEALAMFGG